MNVTLRRFRAIRWAYAPGDSAARFELKQRLARVGHEEQLVTYSDLVAGVTFRLPNVQGGEPFQLGVPDWTDLHRAVIGDFLGYLSMESWERGAFLGERTCGQQSDCAEPSEGFRALLREVDLLPLARQDRVDHVLERTGQEELVPRPRGVVPADRARDVLVDTAVLVSVVRAVGRTTARLN